MGLLGANVPYNAHSIHSIKCAPTSFSRFGIVAIDFMATGDSPSSELDVDESILKRVKKAFSRYLRN